MGSLNPKVELNGRVEPGYEKVAEAFLANFERHDELGAAFCLHVGGRAVVDVWAGATGADDAPPWQEDTLQLVFSTTKGAAAVCAHLLVQRGLLDLDAPVTEYWPEFAAAGKTAVPVGWLLSHRAGLPAIDTKLSIEEVLAGTPVVEALAAQRPLWEPGSAHGYHALTYGWLVGEVVRRVTGASLGRFFADEVAAPLGLEFWIGLPEEQEHRVTTLVPSPLVPPEVADNPTLAELIRKFTGPGSLLWRALSLEGAMELEDLPYNRADVHAAELPAANGITTARSLSRLYAGLVGEVDGVRILDPDTLGRARQPRSEGPDKVLIVPTRFGFGFMLHSDFSPMLGPGSFGHAGAGGSLGFGDADAGVGFGYVMNKMHTGVAGDPRTLSLIEAVRTCL